MKAVSVEQLEALAGPAPSTPTTNGHHANARVLPEFDLESFLAKYLPDAKGPEPWTGHQGPGEIWILDPCPFNPDHTGGCAQIIRHAGGAISANCHHNSCMWDWKALRSLFEPDAYSRQLQANTHADGAPAGTVRQSVPEAIDKPFCFERVSTAELLDNSPAPEYLVEGILVDQQPMLLGGMFKTLKTSIALDLGVSLATGGHFLGYFKVSQPVRVGIFSGESGRHTLAETTSRIARQAGIDPYSQLDGLVWSTDVPKLTRLSHLEALERFILDDELSAVFVDPLYMALAEAGKDASNVFLMGTALGPLSEISKRTGATVVLLHHVSRGAARLRGFEAPELADLSYSGTAEFCRQWLLLGRRAAYEPGTGRHELWMTVGGSAGHTGLYALTIDEGRQDDLGGRIWQVQVQHADEARQGEAERRESAAANQRSESAE